MTQETKKSVTSYLDALRWDGTPRLSRWLVDYAGAEDTAHVRAVSRAALIAAVHRARNPGCAHDEMLVLEGPQGGSKSMALRILAVEVEWFSEDVRANGAPQEIIEATAGKWIVELSELGHMGAGDVAALKAFVSTREDVGRGSYQRESSRMPRQFVIVGTTTESEWLRDPVGNRRFWPVRVERFDLERLRTDRDQLWAEAAAAEAIQTEAEKNATRTSFQKILQINSSAARSNVGSNSELHGKILGFLMAEWARKDSRQLIGVDLLHSPGQGFKDEEIRKWIRADEPEVFAEFLSVEKLVAQILKIAEEEVEGMAPGKHRFIVRTHQHMGGRATMSFAMSPSFPDDCQVVDRSAYVVINHQRGVEFSSQSLDGACAYVADKLREQALETGLSNPSSYHIKRVKAG